MRFLKTNTAVIVTVGPFYDMADGVTIKTALTITDENITLVKDLDEGSAPTIILDNIAGAASGTDNDLNYIADCDAGLMQLELTEANLNFCGRLFLTITDADNHVPVFHEFMVLSAQAYDSLFGTGNLFADIKAIAGVAAAATNLSESAGTIYMGTVTGAATSSSLIDSGLTQSAEDFWKGRIVIFTSGALAKQATDILTFDPATDKITFSVLTAAPSGSDTYVIV